MDRPNDRDYRNLEERNAAYWREQADKLADLLLRTKRMAEAYTQGAGDIFYTVMAEADSALAEYNASK
jgi:hypothetical protein